MILKDYLIVIFALVLAVYGVTDFIFSSKIHKMCSYVEKKAHPIGRATMSSMIFDVLIFLLGGLIFWLELYTLLNHIG